MIRLLTAVALLLTPASVLAHDPVPLPVPVMVECPMPELLANGMIDPTSIDPRCMTTGSIAGDTMHQMQAQAPLAFAIDALTDADGISVRVAHGGIRFTDGLDATIGCNRLGAQATINESGAVTLRSELRTTLMFCPELADIEALLTRILTADHLVLDVPALELRSDAGSVALAPLAEHAAASPEATPPVDHEPFMDHGQHHRDHTDSGVGLALLAAVAALGFLLGVIHTERRFAR
jgi:hypothetical protein